MEKSCLLLMLVGGTYALATVPKTKCNVQIVSHCTSVSGGTAYIKLMDNAFDYMLVLYKELYNESVIVFSVEREHVTIGEKYEQRVAFSISTGILRITDVEEDDAGEYTLDVYTLRGLPVKTLSFTLQIKARRIDFGVSLSAPGAIVVISICLVVWKYKRCRKSGYETLNQE